MWSRRARSTSGACLALRPRAGCWQVPRGGGSRKRGCLGGRSVACDRSGDRWMRAVRRGLTIGDDRPVIAERSDGVSSASLGAIRRGWVMRRLVLFGDGSEGRCGRNGRWPSRLRVAHDKHPAAGSLTYRRWLAIAGPRELGSERSGFGRECSLGRSGSGPRGSTVTSAVGPQCVDPFGDRVQWTLTAPYRRSGPRGRKPLLRLVEGAVSQVRTAVRSLVSVRIRKGRPRQGTDAGVVRLAAAVILCSGA